MRAARDSKKKSSKRSPSGTGAAAARKFPAGKFPDMTALSDDDLAALVSLVEQELAGRRERKRREFFASVREQAEALGFAPEEVAAELGRKGARGVADRRTTVAPKYRNPMNPAETWAGRGVKPRWMQALLAQGKSMDDFKIPS